MWLKGDGWGKSVWDMDGEGLTLIRLGYFGGWKDWGGAMMAPP